MAKTYALNKHYRRVYQTKMKANVYPVCRSSIKGKTVVGTRHSVISSDVKFAGSVAVCSTGRPRVHLDC